MYTNISVIIPFYNRSRYLFTAIESVFFQTVGDIELILVDDGSIDGSLDHARRYLAELSNEYPVGDVSGTLNMTPNYSDVGKCYLESNSNNVSTVKKSALRHSIFIRIPHSGMPGLVRNQGVEAANSPLIAFLDSDDIWHPRKLERQLSLHEHVRVSHTRERWLRAISPTSVEDSRSRVSAHSLPRLPEREIIERDNILFQVVSQKRQRHQREGNIFRDALWKCIMGPSTVIMDTLLFEELGGFREDLEVAEDYEFWLRVTAKEWIAYVDEPLVEKRAAMPNQNQLSEYYGYIEPFRVQALSYLLESPNVFNTEQTLQARRVLKRKEEIVRTGAKKRGIKYV